MNLNDLNIGYYDSYSRLKDAFPGYFFVVSRETLSTIFHPSMSTNITTLDNIIAKELNSSYSSPTETELTAIFSFSDLTIDKTLIFTPLDTSPNTSGGLGPDKISLTENVNYKKINFIDANS